MGIFVLSLVVKNGPSVELWKICMSFMFMLISMEDLGKDRMNKALKEQITYIHEVDNKHHRVTEDILLFYYLGTTEEI